MYSAGEGIRDQPVILGLIQFSKQGPASAKSQFRDGTRPGLNDSVATLSHIKPLQNRKLGYGGVQRWDNIAAYAIPVPDYQYVM